MGTSGKVIDRKMGIDRMASSYYHFYKNFGMLHGSMLHVMGTRFDIILCGKEENLAIEIWSQIVILLKELYGKLNRFDKCSDVSLINQYAYYNPVKVSDCIFRILMDCQRYFEATGGLFDITLNDFSQVKLNKKEQTVFFSSNNTYIDLGGFAKGFAIEKIKEILITNNVEDAFVDFGNSSILAMGSHPNGNSWRVSILNSFNQKTVLDELELIDQSLSSSGNAYNHTMHIKNTKTGEFTHERKMVSVISENAVEAEVISTALMIATPEEINTIMNQLNVDDYKIYNM